MPPHRHSHDREFKLEVIEWCKNPEKGNMNKTKTAKHFSLNFIDVHRWLQTEEAIKKSKKGTRKIHPGKTVKYPLMEQQLHHEFLQFREQGLVYLLSDVHVCTCVG